MNKLASVSNVSGTSGGGRPMYGLLPLCGLLLGLAVLLLAFGGCSDDETLPTFQPPPPIDSPDWLFDVAGTAEGNVYVCGNNGAMYRYDGTTWSRQDMGTDAAIVAMAANAAGTELYAVGHGGRIWRNTGTSWNGMTSGTTANLYGIGSFGGSMYATGWAGAVRRLSGTTWNGAGGTMFVLDEADTPVDTLLVAEDIASLVVVNHYFLGGAYLDPEFEADEDVEVTGIMGTKGGVLAANTIAGLNAEWILRPLTGEDPARAPYEWIISTHSEANPDSIGRNYLGTSEGWLFQLTRDDTGKNVWDKSYPSFTLDPGAGINAVWLDAAGNVYLVTDEGDVWFQSRNYDLVEQTGRRVRLYDGRFRLTGIWGTDPDNLFIVGFEEDKVMRASHDQATDGFTVTTEDLPVPAKAARSGGDEVDPAALPDDFFGRPLR